MKLFNADCLEVLKGFDDESIDLVVTDCPYHITSGGASNHISNDRSAIFNHNNKEATQGKLFKHNEIEFHEWLPELFRVLKNDTHCYIMIDPRNLKDLWQDAEIAGFIYQNLLVWEKGNVTPNRYYMKAYELILMLRKGNAKTINNPGEKNILRVPNIRGAKKHPTEKPAELMQILVENSTREGEIVLDPFMGVGGVGVACKNSGRDFIGIEIDEKYYKIAEERMKDRTVAIYI